MVAGRFVSAISERCPMPTAGGRARDNGLLAPELAVGIGPREEREAGVTSGRWLTLRGAGAPERSFTLTAMRRACHGRHRFHGLLSPARERFSGANCLRTSQECEQLEKPACVI